MLNERHGEQVRGAVSQVYSTGIIPGMSKSKYSSRYTLAT